jgi:hypothetical protein
MKEVYVVTTLWDNEVYVFSDFDLARSFYRNIDSEDVQMETEPIIDEAGMVALLESINEDMEPAVFGDAEEEG